jgi:tetratricopeptide (TPR) repeat protein
MICCIFAFYLVAPTAGDLRGYPGDTSRDLPALLRPGDGQSPEQAGDADELYRRREDMANASHAASIWSARAQSGHDFEASWKLARISYWLGTQGPEAERRAALDNGVKAGQQAATLEPGRPEGHFWMAANMGRLAESFGLSQGLKYRGRVKEELERVVAIDPAWQQGSADRGLGVWYYRVPRLFGGSDSKAIEHLQKALTYNPQSSATLYFMAEAYLDAGRRAEARTALQQVLDAPLDPEWAPEDKGFKRQATEQLKKLGNK